MPLHALILGSASPAHQAPEPTDELSEQGVDGLFPTLPGDGRLPRNLAERENKHRKE